LLTAAHKTLPLGTLVKVTEALSGKSVIVRINDRGPFHGDRAIDLSEAAAKQLGIVAAGTGKVAIALMSKVQA
jgi:rare lipoprotein A